LIYTSELSLRSYSSNIVTYGFVLISAKLLISVAHMQLTHVSYMSALYLNIATNVVTLPLLMRFLPESPHFLYATGQSSQFFPALQKLHQIKRGFASGGQKLDITALALKEPSQKGSHQEPFSNNQPNGVPEEETGTRPAGTKSAQKILGLSTLRIGESLI